jgi:DNA-binding winged helix-turn-helix (wHTH) protein/TolB-like protein/Flp pilus assembly protein TadD
MSGPKTKSVSVHISYEFGPFRLDPDERLLLYHDQPLSLSSKAFDTLLLLIQRRGHLVQKSEIMDKVWADSFVEEHNIVVTISMLRKVLTNGDGEQKYIETVAKQGYRFIGKVSEVPTGDPGEIDTAPAITPEPSPSVVPLDRNRMLFLYFSGGLVLTGVIVSIFVFVLRSGRHVGASGKIQSLAVLPFRTINTDADHAYLGFGLADAIIAKLADRGGIAVRPTSAVLKYADSAETPLAAGREQKVDAVLTGSVETLPEKLRVKVRLLRTSDGSTLLTDAFEETTDQIFQVENAVAERVSRSMPSNLRGTTVGVKAQQDTNNSEAHELYLKGRYFWNIRTEEGLRRSIEYFRQATVRDPQYAKAYAGLADSYVLLASYGVESPQKAYPYARFAALNALKLDDSLAEAHASLGMIDFYYGWNWEEAEQEFQQALGLNPNYIVAETWYALDLAATGRQNEALNLIERAKEIDPLSPEINVVLGRIFYSGRQYEKAAAAFRDVIELNPSFARAHVRLGMTYIMQRDFTDSIHEFETARKVSGPDPYVDGLLGCAQALSGNTAGANAVLEGLTSRSRDEYVPAFSIALVYIGLGNRNRALDWLEKAYQDRSAYMVYAKTEPLLDPLRSDPRFISLLHRMALL